MNSEAFELFLTTYPIRKNAENSVKHFIQRWAIWIWSRNLKMHRHIVKFGLMYRNSRKIPTLFPRVSQKKERARRTIVPVLKECRQCQYSRCKARRHSSITACVLVQFSHFLKRESSYSCTAEHRDGQDPTQNVVLVATRSAWRKALKKFLHGSYKTEALVGAYWEVALEKREGELLR